MSHPQARPISVCNGDMVLAGLILRRGGNDWISGGHLFRVDVTRHLDVILSDVCNDHEVREAFHTLSPMFSLEVVVWWWWWRWWLAMACVALRSIAFGPR